MFNFVAIPTLNLMPKAKETKKNSSEPTKRSLKYQKKEQAQLRDKYFR